jgi:hypothetical protein
VNFGDVASSSSHWKLIWNLSRQQLMITRVCKWNDLRHASADVVSTLQWRLHCAATNSVSAPHKQKDTTSNGERPTFVTCIIVETFSINAATSCHRAAQDILQVAGELEQLCPTPEAIGNFCGRRKINQVRQMGKGIRTWIK